MTILQILLTIFFVSVPIVVWGYVFSYYDRVAFQLHKFIFWSIAGAVSIVPVIYMQQIQEHVGVPGFLSVFARSQSSAFELIGAFLTSFWIPITLFLLFLCIYSFTNFFLLKQTIFQIIGILFGASIIIGGIAYLIPDFWNGNLTIQGNIFLALSSIIVVYLFVAFLEECMKHLALFGSVGIALDRKDILLFATYSALGFVFLENIIYLSNIGETSGFGGAYFGTWFSRSIVSLLLHIFASLILALGFIQFTRRAGLSSVFAYAQWLFGAVFVHALFNVSLTYGKSGIILLYIFVGYFFFTKIFLDERPESNFYASKDVLWRAESR